MHTKGEPTRSAPSFALMGEQMKQFILASKSPRRREILENLGVTFSVLTVPTDESSEITDPRCLVEELSVRKGLAVKDALKQEGRMTPDTVIISSDTVVAVDGKILGKPKDPADARRMLSLLSGRKHSVISGISLIGYDREGVAHEETEVFFSELTEENLAYYLSTDEPYDKAGAYAVQGKASMWIRGIHGDYFNAVGLPVHRMCCLYREIFGENFR